MMREMTSLLFQLSWLTGFRKIVFIYVVEGGLFASSSKSWAWHVEP
jgi:hypothetical protein